MRPSQIIVYLDCKTGITFYVAYNDKGEMSDPCILENFTDSIWQDLESFFSNNMKGKPGMRAKYVFDFLSNDEIQKLPKQMRKWYGDMKSSFETQYIAMAATTIYTMIFAICHKHNIHGKNLKLNLAKLLAFGLISKHGVYVLEKFSEAGRDPMHAAGHLTIPHLKHALEIINHMLRIVYILPKSRR